ncbi:MAG: hypothetical protein V3V28_02995 [Polaribacter sp.]|uniref:hypothetical protein n=1 Tax=Polaribacter sp. TaxID=1920175 RepID=UPI002F35F1B4
MNNNVNAIPLTTAQNWVKRWRDEESSYNTHNECFAFNIPLIDLQEVINEKGVASIRGYLGVDENNVEKLLIVGVNAQGKDMITIPKSDLRAIGDGGDIYDFSEPCPSVCDDDSPINGG